MSEDIENRICENSFGISLSTCKFLGKGTGGRVYLMPDGKAIKIFNFEEQCRKEYKILLAVKGDKHFPEVYECRGNSMIREFIAGVSLTEYIKQNGLSKNLSLNLIELIEDFKEVGFLRLDMRCAHIFVQEDETVRVIDPREHFSMNIPYPMLLLKGLHRLGVLDNFMNIVKDINPLLYMQWIRETQR